MALKDCFRAHAANGAAAAATAGAAAPGQLRPARPPPPAGARMPFRAHRLTQVLKGCFTDPAHRTVLVVRPASHCPPPYTHWKPRFLT